MLSVESTVHGKCKWLALSMGRLLQKGQVICTYCRCFMLTSAHSKWCSHECIQLPSNDFVNPRQFMQGYDSDGCMLIQ